MSKVNVVRIDHIEVKINDIDKVRKTFGVKAEAKHLDSYNPVGTAVSIITSI